jgi:hypothetical protein
MANKQTTQENPLEAAVASRQSMELTDAEITTLAGGAGLPPKLCRLKPSRQASTLEFIQSIKDGGGKIETVDLESGSVNFKPGTSEPAPGLL